MRNLPRPTLDAEQYYRLIATEKRGKRSSQLSLAEKKVCGAYADYLARSHDFASLAPISLPKTRRATLVHAYNNRTKSMTAMRELLLTPDLEDFDECPYCGIGEPLTLDHYIPKETHPEFSIFPLNLVPLCHACNTTYKKAQFLSMGRTRLFFHCYFDEIPNYKFIKASVDASGAQTRISFEVLHDPLNAEFSSILSHQFSSLNLADRFFRKSSSFVSRNTTTFNRLFTSGGHTRLAQELQSRADELRDRRTDNHWEVALLDALAGSAEFCKGGYTKQTSKG